MHVVFGLTLLGAPLSPATALTLDAEKNYREVVSYDLKATLDPEKKTVTAEGHIMWTNPTTLPVQDLWWHLYLNAFRNDRSTFVVEAKGSKLRIPRFERGQWGFVEVTRLTLVDKTPFDLLAQRTFEHPDDDNADDRTVMRTPLPRAVGPGETITLAIAFTAKLPKLAARTGYAGDFFMVAQWFPKLGVLEETTRNGKRTASWNCHQYHAHSEYFADYGRFKVAITVPEGFVVGATGKRSEERRGDGTVTYVHTQERVHDFAWTASPRFVPIERMFVGAKEVKAEEAAEAARILHLRPADLLLSDVKVTLLIQPEHQAYAERYFAATFFALKWFGLWYGAYPYDVLTVVDGPRTARGAMGMEYPTLITGGVRFPAPTAVASPEAVTVHEFGHQYWYGLVGSNEFEEAWLDEGFNSYSTGKVLDRAYGPSAFAMAPRLLGLPLTPWFGHVRVDQSTSHRLGLLLSPASDTVVRPAWQYRSAVSYGVSSYPRAAVVLRQLEHEVGESTAAQALRLYHLRWRYRHPTTADFVATVEEVAGRPLADFFARTVYSAGAVDYAIDHFSSEKVRTPVGLFASEGGEPKEVTVEEAEQADKARAEADTRYQTELVIERRGEVAWPLSVEVTFADGSLERGAWDGRYRWQRFRWETKSVAQSARLYPDHNMLLDLDTANNSARIEASAMPATTWGAHALYFVQTVLQLVGGLP